MIYGIAEYDQCHYAFYRQQYTIYANGQARISSLCILGYKIFLELPSKINDKIVQMHIESF